MQRRTSLVATIIEQRLSITESFALALAAHPTFDDGFRILFNKCLGIFGVMKCTLLERTGRRRLCVLRKIQQ